MKCYITVIILCTLETREFNVDSRFIFLCNACEMKMFYLIRNILTNWHELECQHIHVQNILLRHHINVTE